MPAKKHKLHALAAAIAAAISADLASASGVSIGTSTTTEHLDYTMTRQPLGGAASNPETRIEFGPVAPPSGGNFGTGGGTTNARSTGGAPSSTVQTCGGVPSGVLVPDVVRQLPDTIVVRYVTRYLPPPNDDSGDNGDGGSNDGPSQGGEGPATCFGGIGGSCNTGYCDAYDGGDSGNADSGDSGNADSGSGGGSDCGECGI